MKINIHLQKVTWCGADKATFLLLKQSIPLLGRYKLGCDTMQSGECVSTDSLYFIQNEGMSIGLINHKVMSLDEAKIHRIVLAAESEKDQSLLAREVLVFLLENDFKEIPSITVATDAQPGIHHHFLIRMYNDLGFTEVRTTPSDHGYDYLLTFKR
jgi:hypothetical protein